MLTVHLIVGVLGSVVPVMGQDPVGKVLTEAQHTGALHPCIQTSEERGLTLLAMRCVNDVIFDVVNNIDTDFRAALGIDRVVNVVNHVDFPQPADIVQEFDIATTLNGKRTVERFRVGESADAAANTAGSFFRAETGEMAKKGPVLYTGDADAMLDFSDPEVCAMFPSSASDAVQKGGKAHTLGAVVVQQLPYYSTNVILERFCANKEDFEARQKNRGPEPGLRLVKQSSLLA
jgi:hypothetical protein